MDGKGAKLRYYFDNFLASLRSWHTQPTNDLNQSNSPKNRKNFTQTESPAKLMRGLRQSFADSNARLSLPMNQGAVEPHDNTETRIFRSRAWSMNDMDNRVLQDRKDVHFTPLPVYKKQMHPKIDNGSAASNGQQQKKADVLQGFSLNPALLYRVIHDLFKKAPKSDEENVLKRQADALAACAKQSNPPMEEVFSIVEFLKENGTEIALQLGITAVVYFSPVLWTAAPFIGFLNIFGEACLSEKGFWKGMVDSVCSLSVMDAVSVLGGALLGMYSYGMMSGLRSGFRNFALAKLCYWSLPHLQNLISEHSPKVSEQVNEYLQWCKEKLSASPVGGAAKYQVVQFLETIKNQTFNGVSRGWERVRQVATHVFAPKQAQPVQLPIAQS